MKTKSLFLLTITMLALAACSENEITEQNPEVNKPIGFDTYASVQTRGQETDIEFIKQHGLGVMAYKTTGDYSTTGAKEEFMKTQRVTWDKTNSKWEYSPVKFWPAGTDEKVSFFAYAPYTDGGPTYNTTLTSADASNNPKVNLTLQTFQYYLHDLVVSNPDDATNGTMNMSSGTVNFKFQHPLTRVAMEAKTGTDISKSTDTKVFITGVSLIHNNILNSKGTLDMKTLTWADNKTDYIKSPYVLQAFSDTTPDCGCLNLTKADFAGYKELSLDISAGGTNTTSLFIKSVGKDFYLFLLPVNNGTGTANAGDVKIKIAYDIVNWTSATTHIKSSVEKEVSLPAGVFKKGAAHRFIFTIGLNAITFNVDTDASWGAETDNSITVQ